MLTAYAVCLQLTQGASGVQMIACTANPIALCDLRLQKYRPEVGSSLHGAPCELTKKPLPRLNFFKSSYMQASQFSPLVGPQWPSQQLHLPIKFFFPQQCLPVSPKLDSTESLLRMAEPNSGIEREVTGKEDAFWSFILEGREISDCWKLTTSYTNYFGCASAICLTMPSTVPASEQSWQERGLRWQNLSCSYFYLVGILRPQLCWQGTLMELIMRLAIMEGLQVKELSLQLGQSLCLRLTSRKQASHIIWPQHWVSTAWRATQVQMRQAKSSYMFMVAI